MKLLAVETSCDETSVALVDQGRLLSNLVSSQVALHAEYGGVVPELATRAHLHNLPLLARSALSEAGLQPSNLEAVAATIGPGLPNALVVGLKFAQGLAAGLDVPFLAIHHHEAHLISPWISACPSRLHLGDFRPHVSLVVSGGHTMLVQVRAQWRYRVLGETLDDAAGECFDKIAKLIGLPYPGGPELDRLAKEGDPKAFTFPRPLLRDRGDDFSYSGLKTSVRYFLRDRPELLDDGQLLRDLCASVQSAIVDTLVIKTVRCARRLGLDLVTASGGVTCNSGLRSRLGTACREAGLELKLALPPLCTDNAGMVGVLAEQKLAGGTVPSSLDADVRPGLALGDGDDRQD